MKFNLNDPRQGLPALLVVAAVVITLVTYFTSDKSRVERSLVELPGTMTLIADEDWIRVYHLEYRDRHYLVTNEGGIMVLPRWVEGSAKVAKPLEELGPRRRGPEPPLKDHSKFPHAPSGEHH